MGSCGPEFIPTLYLERFLYTGQTGLKYIAGQYTLDKFGTSDFLTTLQPSIECLTAAKKNTKYAAPVVYMLAIAIRNLSKEEKDFEIRDKFYQIVPTILENSDELMLFVKYTTELGLTKGTKWQNCIKAWYRKCNYNLLIQDISRMRCKHGWAHKDVLRLLHLNPNCGEEASAVIRYIWSGLHGLSELSYIPKNILEELEIIIKLRKTRDFKEAETYIRKISGLKINQVPKHLLYSQKDNSEVWKALIKQISPSDFLNSLEYLQNAGMLENHVEGKPSIRPQLTSNVISALSTVTVSPTLAFIAYCNYKNNRGFLQIVDKSAKVKNLKNAQKDEKKRNECVKGYLSKTKSKTKYKHNDRCSPAPELIKALMNVVDRSIKCIDNSIDVTCLITIDQQSHMFRSIKMRNLRPSTTEQNTAGVDDVLIDTQKDVIVLTDNKKPAKCYYNKNVVPGNAARFLALSLSKYFKHTYVGVYCKGKIQNVDVKMSENGSERVLTLDEADKKFNEVLPGRVMFHKPFDWAMKEKKKIKLFVNIVDTAARIYKYSNNTHNKYNDISTILSEYRSKMNSPETKVVTIALATHKSTTNKMKYDTGVYDISGFDEQIPEIIRNFALDNF